MYFLHSKCFVSLFIIAVFRLHDQHPRRSKCNFAIVSCKLSVAFRLFQHFLHISNSLQLYPNIVYFSSKNFVGLKRFDKKIQYRCDMQVSYDNGNTWTTLNVQARKCLISIKSKDNTTYQAFILNLIILFRQFSSTSE